MTYVMSDPHGQLALFERMLTQIHFSSNDHLYIIGDVVDRGPHGNRLLLLCMETPNITLLKGNHEDMYQQALEIGLENSHNDLIEIWYRNGGRTTAEEFLYELTPEEQASILAYLPTLPLFCQITVEGKAYYLVHGAPMPEDWEAFEQMRLNLEKERLEPKDHLLWQRILAEDYFFESTITLFGHTPTVNYQEGIPPRIWHGNRLIGLDCGCASVQKGGRLGCLRLEDMIEFYAGL